MQKGSGSNEAKNLRHMAAGKPHSGGGRGRGGGFYLTEVLDALSRTRLYLKLLQCSGIWLLIPLAELGASCAISGSPKEDCNILHSSTNPLVHSSTHPLIHPSIHPCFCAQEFPDFRQAEFLKGCIEEGLVRDGLVGVGAVAAVAGVAGLVAVALLGGKRR